MNFQEVLSLLFSDKWAGFILSAIAGRRSWGMIVLSQEQTKQSRTMTYGSEKKSERVERILKNVGTICKGTEWNGNFWKAHLISGTSSYYQECVLSRERILNQEYVLNHLEIIERFFCFESISSLAVLSSYHIFRKRKTLDWDQETPFLKTISE